MSDYSQHGVSVLAALTDTDPGGNRVQFATADDLAIPSSNRFITFSVDAAATNCFSAHPLMDFYFTVGGVEQPLSTTPIDPCNTADPRTQVLGGSGQAQVRGGTYAANGSFLSTGSDFSIVMRNRQPLGGGNDGAIDNIRVLDVTPQLDKSFSPAETVVGGTSRLTLTVTNTS